MPSEFIPVPCSGPPAAAGPPVHRRRPAAGAALDGSPAPAAPGGPGRAAGPARCAPPPARCGARAARRSALVASPPRPHATPPAPEQSRIQVRKNMNNGDNNVPAHWPCRRNILHYNVSSGRLDFMPLSKNMSHNKYSCFVKPWELNWRTTATISPLAQP